MKFIESEVIQVNWLNPQVTGENWNSSV